MQAVDQVEEEYMAELRERERQKGARIAFFARVFMLKHEHSTKTGSRQPRKHLKGGVFHCRGSASKAGRGNGGRQGKMLLFYTIVY